MFRSELLNPSPAPDGVWIVAAVVALLLLLAYLAEALEAWGAHTPRRRAPVRARRRATESDRLARRTGVLGDSAEGSAARRAGAGGRGANRESSA